MSASQKLPYPKFGLVIDLGTHLSQVEDRTKRLSVFIQAVEKRCFTTVSTIKLNDLKLGDPEEVSLFTNLLETLGAHLNLTTLEMKDVHPQLVRTMARILPSFHRLILLDLSNSNIPFDLVNELIDSIILDVPYDRVRVFRLSLSGQKAFIDVLYEHVKTLAPEVVVTQLISIDKYFEQQNKLFSQYNDPIEKGKEMGKYFASLDKNSPEYISLVSAYEISAESKVKRLEICIKLNFG